MSSIIKRFKRWEDTHPKLKKWVWFAGLYLAAIISVGLIEFILHQFVHFLQSQ